MNFRALLTGEVASRSMEDGVTALDKMEGKCLCAAVTLRVNAKTEIGACHCGMCRRWGGGPFLSLHCGADVQIEGSEHVSRYASSPWAERAFCRNCGTHLFYRLVPADDHIVPAGLFQSQNGAEPDFELTEQIFIDRKPGYYSFANQTLLLTEAEVFAKYAPK